MKFYLLPAVTRILSSYNSRIRDFTLVEKFWNSRIAFNVVVCQCSNSIPYTRLRQQLNSHSCWPLLPRYSSFKKRAMNVNAVDSCVKYRILTVAFRAHTICKTTNWIDVRLMNCYSCQRGTPLFFFFIFVNVTLYL